MPIENYDIVGSYNNQRVSSIDSERSVNLFEYLDPLGKKDKSLLSTSGLENTDIIFLSAGLTDGFRGQFVANLGSSQLMFSVVGANVYRTNQAFITTKINTLPLDSSTGYVGIDANNGGTDGNVQVIFVDGSKGYIYDTITGAWTQITDAAFPAMPLDVCYLDGFFIVAHGNTNFFQLSQLNEGLIWGQSTSTFTLAAGSANITLTTGNSSTYPVGTPIVVSGSTVAEIPNGTYYVVSIISATVITVSATAGGTAITSAAGGAGSLTNSGQLQRGAITSHPGTIVGCRTLHRRLFLFSQYYTEVWENAGLGTNLPLRRNNSSLMEYGTPAVGSISVGFDKMFFLSQDRDGLGSVMEVVGTEAIPVSNRALDFALAQYVSEPTIGVSDCRAFLIKENGLIFYRMNFTNADHTYIYNVSMSDEQNKRWHEEEMLDGSRHVSQTHGYFYGVNYVGSYKAPIMYSVDNSFITNDGEAIKRMRIGRPVMPPTSQRLRIDRFQLDLLQGQISVTGSISEELDLLAEDGSILLTESGDNIITETGAVIFNSNMAPTVFLSISKDGGQSYGYRNQAPMGNIGQRTFRTVWRKLGTTKRGQAFVPKLEFFNTTPFIILGATWFYDILPE